MDKFNWTEDLDHQNDGLFLTFYTKFKSPRVLKKPSFLPKVQIPSRETIFSTICKHKKRVKPMKNH